MNKTTFNAAVALLLDRWPFPEESAEFRKDWIDRLKLAVSDWNPKRTVAFKQAIEALMADKHRARSRPSVEQIVESALARAGEGSRIIYGKDETPKGAHPGGFVHPPEVRKAAAEKLRVWTAANRHRMAASPMFGPRNPVMGDDQQAPLGAPAPERRPEAEEIQERVRAATAAFLESAGDDDEDAPEEIPF